MALIFSVMQKRGWMKAYRSGWGSRLGVAIALCLAIFSLQVSWAQEVAPAESRATESRATESPATESAETTDSPAANPAVNPLQDIAPPEVRAFFRDGSTINFETAPIYLDGRFLFEVAAPLRSDSWRASDRAHEIGLRLQRRARNLHAQEQLREVTIASKIDDPSNQPIITIDNEVLMTVTYLDAQLDGSANLQQRASQIVVALEDAIARYDAERQPSFRQQQARWTAAAVLLTVLGSFALAHFHQELTKRQRQLRNAEAATVDTNEAEGINERSPHSFVNRIRRTALTQQRVKSLRTLRQTLQMSQVALWSGSVFIVLGFFPYTRWLQPFAIKVLRLPIRILVVGLVAYGLIRLLDVWIDRMFLAVQTQATLTVEGTQRLLLRLSTFSQVIKASLVVLISVIALLVMLRLSGVQVAPLLAGAGLLGIALSLASQSLVKDIINGFLILFEDQYGVGDVVSIKDITGFVETMNLRMTQLRDTEGRLTTVPNGQIDIVQNLSKEWSRVDLGIPVGLEADTDKALTLIDQVASEMSQDAAWGALILEPPLLLGVDSLDHTGTTIRLWIKTQPLKQWDVAREYRRRLKAAFDVAGIAFGIPQQVLHVGKWPVNVATRTLEDQVPKNGGTY